MVVVTGTVVDVVTGGAVVVVVTGALVVVVSGGRVVVVVVVLVVVDDVVVVVTTAVLSSVALPIATPMPAPASNKTNAMPHTPAGLTTSPLSALRAGPLGPRSARA